MGETDLLPPPSPVPTERTPKPKDLRCGFCESFLTPSGEVMKLSERAKSLRDFEDDLEDVKRDLATAREEIDVLKQQINDRDGMIKDLQGKLQKASKFW